MACARRVVLRRPSVCPASVVDPVDGAVPGLGPPWRSEVVAGRGAVVCRPMMPEPSLRALLLVSLVSWLAQACDSGPVRLELVRKFGLLGGVVAAAAFSPDGKVLVTAGETGDLRALEVASGKVLWTVSPGDHPSDVVAFSPDGAKVACGGLHLTVHCARSGEVLLQREDVAPRAFVWRRDGAGFVYSRGDNLIVHRHGERERVRATFDRPIDAIGESDDGGLLVGDIGGSVWRVTADGRAPHLWRNHPKPAEGCLVGCASLGSAGGVTFDVPSNGPVYRGDAAFVVPGGVFAFTVSSDGGSFAAGGGAPVVRWWRGAGREWRDLQSAAAVSELALHPDGDRLFCATSDGKLAILTWDGSRRELPPHPARVAGLVLSPDSSMLAIRGTAWQLQPTAGGPSKLLPNARGAAPGRRGGELIVVEPTRVILHDAARGTELACGHEESGLLPVAAGPDDTLLMRGNLVDLATGTVRGTCDPLRFANSVVVTRSAQRWCAGTVWGLDGETGDLALTDATGALIAHRGDGPVHDVTFSPDGRKIYYCCGGDSPLVGFLAPRRLRVRDADTFELLQDVEASARAWRCLDAEYALAFGEDGLELWDAARLVRIQHLQFQGRDLQGRLAADGSMVVSYTGSEVEVYRVRYTPRKK